MTADAVRTRRCEGPHRFTQKRPRTFVSGLASIAAVETSKHRLSRDFQRRSIFDFCNNICQQETHALQQKASYSITSSARTSKEGGTVRPSSLAVFRLITNSNLVGCSTGRSEGLVPLSILST